MPTDLQITIQPPPAIQIELLAGYGVPIGGGGGGGGFDGTFAALTGKPTTLAGYGITDAQPLDSDLTAIAALSTTAFGRGLLTQSDAAEARATLGAGTSSFDGTFAALTGKPTTLLGYGIADAQPLNFGLTAIAALSTTAFGRGLLTQSDAAAARATLGAGTSSFDGTFAALTGKPTTLAGYGIADAQPLDSDLTAIAALSTTAFGRGLLTQSDAAAARATLGAGTSSFDGTFAALTGKPTTLAGYAITDAVGTTGNQSISGAKTFSDLTTFRGLICSNSPGIASGTVGAATYGADAGTNPVIYRGTAVAALFEAGINQPSGNFYGFSSGTPSEGNADVRLFRDAADALALRRGTNAQRFNLYGTFTDAANYRRAFIRSTAAGAFTLGVEGLGTGLSGNTLAIGNPLTVNGTLTVGTYTLPASDGTNGQVLKTNGAGVVTWAADATGGGGGGGGLSEEDAIAFAAAL